MAVWIAAIALLAASAPDRGSIELSFQESGSLYVDGTLLARTISGRFPLDPGLHVVRIVPSKGSPGCQPLEGFVQILEAQTTDLVIDADGRSRHGPDHYLNGCVTAFQVDDPGTRVLLDGEPSRSEDGVLISTSGPHRLTVHDADGSTTYEAIVELHTRPMSDPQIITSSPSPLVPSVSLPPGKGALMISLREFGSCYVDGILANDPTGNLRQKTIPMDPGLHEIRVVAADRASGCLPLEGSVEIRAGRISRRITLVDGTNLDSANAYLRGCRTNVMVVIPPGLDPMNVELDDRPVGMTGERLEASSGPHTLALFRLVGKKKVVLYRGDVELETREPASPQVERITPPSEKSE